MSAATGIRELTTDELDVVTGSSFSQDVCFTLCFVANGSGMAAHVYCTSVCY